MRELLNEYEPSRELSLARTKLDECELWLTRCTVTEEAFSRDQGETGLGRVQAAVRRARGGDAPAQAQGFA